MVAQAKVVGSAQRRRPAAALLHGSVLLARAERTPELPGLLELIGQPPDIEGWAERFSRAIPRALGFEPLRRDWTASERQSVRRLVHDVYCNPRWTAKR